MKKANTENLDKTKENHAGESDNNATDKNQEYSKYNLIFKTASIKQKFIEFANNTWYLKASKEADTENYLPLEMAWITPDQQTAIHYIEDWYLEDGAVYPFSLKTPYLIIEGKNIEKVARLVRSFFDTYSDAEIIRWVKSATNSDDLINAVVNLGYAAPENFDSRFFFCLKTALSNSDTWVRLAAVWASGCIGWYELQEVLKNISETDSSDDVQLLASQMLQVFNIEGENRLFTVLDKPQDTMCSV